MLRLTQVSKACQEEVFRLHNLCSHPAVSESVSEVDLTAVSAAVKPWSSAVLELHCSSQHPQPSSQERAASDYTLSAITGDAQTDEIKPKTCTPAQDSVTCPREAVTGSHAAGATAETTGRHNAWAPVQQNTCERCMPALAAAAADSIKRLQQVLFHDKRFLVVLLVLHTPKAG